MDGGAWWATVHGIAKSWTQLSDFTFTFQFHANTQTQETTIVNPGQEGQQAGQEVSKDSLMIQPIVFEDKELSSILGDIAPYYHYEVVYQNKAAKSIRIYFTWDMAASIEDVVETFNKFDRIHITKENNKLIVK